eukprot:625837-Amphidinium_carterae.1
MLHAAVAAAAAVAAVPQCVACYACFALGRNLQGRPWVDVPCAPPIVVLLLHILCMQCAVPTPSCHTAY